MKKYIEILEDISKERAALQELEKQQKKLENIIYIKGGNFEEWKAHREMMKDQRAELDSIYDSIAVSELRIKYMNHNRKLALYNEVLPVLIQLLEKYNGKAAGPKTKERFSKEFHDLTGCRAFVGNNYCSPHFTIYGPHEETLAIYTRYDTTPLFLDGENRFNAPAIENVYLGCIKNQYFEDIDAAIKGARDAMAHAVKVQAELNAACMAFNDFAVEGMKIMSIYDHRSIGGNI